MQKKTFKYSILGIMVLIISVMLTFFGVFTIHQKPVKAENDMGEIRAKIITVDNATNNILSEREISFDDIDSNGNPFVYLDSYIELDGATVNGTTLTYYDGTQNQTSNGTTTNGIISFAACINETDGVAYYTESLGKVIWFKTKPIVLDLFDITTTTFSYKYNGTTFTEDFIGNFENGINITTIHTSFGSLSGTISNYSEENQTATWTSNEKYVSHEAIQIKVGSLGEPFYFSTSEMNYNGRLIGSSGNISQSPYSYYSKEYHGLPGSIIDNCNISQSAYTKDSDNTFANNLENLEGKYSFKAVYRLQFNQSNEITKNFIFYLTTSNTYSNPNELLNFYNVNSVVSETDSSQKNHYFAFNNILTNNLLDFDAKVLENANLSNGTLSYNNEKGNTEAAAIEITEGIYYQVVVNDVRGLAYKDSKTGTWMWTDKLLYPTISYNPEKYVISFRKTLFSYVENYTFDFSVNDDLYATLTLYKINNNGSRTQIEQKTIYRKTDKLTGYENLNISNNNLVSLDYESTTYNALDGKVTISGKTYYYNKVTETVCEYNLDAPFIAYHTFKDIGDYSFSQQYMLKIAEDEYYITNGINATENDIQSVSNTIHINGYEAIYRNNGTDVKFLNNENFYSDFSYLLTSVSGLEAIYEKTTSIEYSSDGLNLTSQSLYAYINKDRLVSTNQTPVTLRYNATKNNKANSMWYVYINDNGTIEEVSDYTNSVSFSAAGIYFVFLSFQNNANTDNYNQQLYIQQVLAFRITNSQAVVSVKSTDESNSSNITARGENELSSNSFTNKNVFIEWLKNNEFDTPITATYDQFDFNGNKIYSNKPLNGLVYDKNGEILSSNPTLFTNSGKYIVRVRYTNTGSSIIRTFTIDKEQISGIAAYSAATKEMLSNKDDFNLSVGKAFAWSWDLKASGANITASYYYSNLTAKPDFELTKLYNLSETECWVNANGVFSSLKSGPNYPYTNVINDFSSEQIISSNCLAILLLEDEAGNTASFITIYDSIEPEIIQERKQENPEQWIATTTSLINTTTKFTWGDYKALDASQIQEEFQNLTNKIEINEKEYNLDATIRTALSNHFRLSSNNNYYYTQKISKAEIIQTNSQTNNQVFSGPSAYVVILKNNSTNTYNAYISQTESASGTPYPLTDNIPLLIEAEDNLNNKGNLNKNISLDQSDGRIFSHQENIDISSISDTTNGSISEANRQQVYSHMISNRDYLTFSFKQEPSGNVFEVEKIVLKFYELTYQDEYNPYSSTAIEYIIFTNDGHGMVSNVHWTECDSDDSSLTTGTYYQSSALNVGPNGYTIQGKYVFERYYVTESKNVNITDEELLDNIISSGDVALRSYTAYVDRTINPMLESSLNLGETINGYSSNESTKTFNSFGNQSNAKTEFSNSFNSEGENIYAPTVSNISTNMVPAIISLKNNSPLKYNNQNLVVIVQTFNKNSKLQSQTLFTADVESVSDNGINIVKPFSMLSSSIKKIGTYRVMICDYSNLNKKQITEWDDLNLWNNKTFAPNVVIFSFDIKNNTPQIEIKNSSTLTNINELTINNIPETAYINNDNYVMFKFSDTIDIYSAKIAYKSWTLSRTSFTLNEDGIMTTVEETSISPINYNVREYGVDSFTETEIQRINGTYSGENITSFSLYNGIVYYRVKIAGYTDRYDYYIILPKNKQNFDCLYTLTINYIGKADSYSELTYSQTKSVYIDNTSPYRVLLNLIENDTYLTDEQKTEMKSNLNNHNYEFLKYYAFNVGISFDEPSLFSGLESSYYYYTKVENKYNGSGYANQTVIPESDDYHEYPNLAFNKNKEGFFSNDYSTPITEGGYYDIVEIDDAGNHRVYTIYITETNSEVSLNATASNYLSDSINYNFISKYDKTNAENIYTIIENNSNIIYTTTDSSPNSTPYISGKSFNLSNLKITDSWYKVSFSLINGALKEDLLNNYVYNVAPQNYLISIINSNKTNKEKEEILSNYKTKNEIIEILNNFIQQIIEKNSILLGSQIKITFNNRSGKDIDFYLLTPGKEIEISNLSPERVGNTLFRITMPADSYSTKYSDFEIKRNAETINEDNSSPKINLLSLNTVRNNPTILSFSMSGYNYKYTFNFKDNFGRVYKFTYPTTEDAISGIIYEEGSTPQVYNGITYTSNTTKFTYRTGGDDRISIKIYDVIEDRILIDEKDLVYTTNGVENSLVKICGDNRYSKYLSQTLSLQSIVTITFNAIKNAHLTYEIVLIDVDNNRSSYNFGIYNFAPNTTLSDTSGILIWATEDLWSNTKPKITSKSVVTRFATNSEFLFNPKVYIEKDSIRTQIITGYTSRNIGNYKVMIINDLGVMNLYTINFTIREATSDLYSVYFADEKLSPHTLNNYRYRYEIKDDGDNVVDVKYIYNYFFLSNSDFAWEDIRILPSEDQDLEVKYLETQGNTRIYEISNENLTTYCAITQVYPVANNDLTDFYITKSTNGTYTKQPDDEVKTTSKLTVYPQTADGKPTYVKLFWEKAEEGIENFIYLYITYNDSVTIGRVSDDIELTRSGKYTIQIYDAVGQVHRFGDRDYFTLLILNEINYYINDASPIQNATYNDEVNLSLVDTNDFDWKNTGKITVLRNNVIYNDYVSSGTSWTFTEAGYYKVTISAALRNSSTNNVVLSTTAQFTILDKNEAKPIFDFAKTSGYYVSTIQRITYTKDEETGEIVENYTDITNELKESLGVNRLDNFKLSRIGRYLITVTVNSSLSVEEQYSFVIWINDENLNLLLPSRSWGSSSTKSFKVQYNPSNIFEQIGSCYIKVNNNIVATIDENNSQNQKSSFTVSGVGTHIVQIYSKSGSLISSQRMTINKPLNTAAIILIVVGVLVAVGIIVLFVMFRTKMKVK